MLTLPKLLRRPLPPKIHPKPLHLKKEKIQSAITNEVSKQQDLLKPCLGKIISTEIEKNVIPRKFPKRRRQSRIHIKNLLLKWRVKRHRNTFSKMFLKKYPKFYLLFSNIKDDYGGYFYVPTCNLIKDYSEKSSEQYKKRDSATSETLTLASSQLGQSSSFIKHDLDHKTTPDSTYGPPLFPSVLMGKNKTESKKEKINWYEKLTVPHHTVTNQRFSFDELPGTTKRTPYIQSFLELSKTEEEKSSQKESTPVEKSVSFTDVSSEISEPEEELIVHGEGYFQDSALHENESKLHLACVAVRKCHQHSRNALSFKGFFIDRCPDLSILANRLVYLNLAFNDFTIFPPEVLVLINLQVLIMRNNPIKEIPSDIEALKHLTVFVISFNLLTSLPNGLFALSELEYLDASYNEITFIPNEIQNLSSLNNLNLDGNELIAMPPGVFKLSLDNFSIENNYTHPVLWKANSKNNAQSLKDLALWTFSQHHLWEIYTMLPPEIKEQQFTSKLCDYCQGPLYGKGLHFIRPFTVSNVPLLPVLFNICSPRCYKHTKRDPNILALWTR